MGSLSPTTILDAGVRGLMGVINTAVPVVSLARQVADDVRHIRGADNTSAANNLAAQQQFAMAQLQEQQRISEAQAAQDAALQRQEMAAETATAEQARRMALKRAVARQKVSLASQGVSAADDGSAEAILLGMFQESEDEKQARGRMDGLREQALSQTLAQRQALNVLQRAQLAERQKLERELAG
jgi:hypothetical protein